MNPAKFLPRFSALLALCFVSAPAQAPSRTTLPDLPSAAALGEELFRNSGATGMVLVAVRGNQVFFHGYGETAPGSHQLPAQDSVVRLCSLTKIFTTDVLAKLVADKTVRLDDPLQRFAPRRVVVPSRVRAITLEDLATHTSGLPRELGVAPRGTPHFTFPDYATRWRWLPNQHPARTPGTSALYSNVAFDLLGDALESAAHKQYAALLSERTLKPLRMYNTTYFPNAAQCSRLLKSAHDEGPCTTTEQTAGSSGLYSTAGDMAIWLEYLLGTGAPAQDPAAQAVYIPLSSLTRQQGLDHAGEPSGVGLGWIHIEPADSLSHIVEKTGGGAGFITYIAINHARRTAIFVAATDGPDRPRAGRVSSVVESVAGGSGPDTLRPDASGPQAPHLNLFNAANNLLLTMSGLPPLPPPPSRFVAAKRRRAKTRRR